VRHAAVAFFQVQPGDQTQARKAVEEAAIQVLLFLTLTPFGAVAAASDALRKKKMKS